MSDPLRNHRDIVALAAARVDRRYKAAARRLSVHGTIPGGYVRDRAIDEEVELDLLLDPAEPDLDALSRILAARVGVVVGATAPMFYRELHRNGWEWALEVKHEDGMTRVMFGESDAGWNADLAKRHLRIIPGISTLTSPTDALFAALNATRPV